MNGWLNDEFPFGAWPVFRGTEYSLRFARAPRSPEDDLGCDFGMEVGILRICSKSFET